MPEYLIWTRQSNMKKPYKHTKEHILNNTHSQSMETRRKISKSHMGIKPTRETRKKMSLSHKGKPSNMKGKKHTKETKSKMRKAKFGKTGLKANNWQGGKSFEPYSVDWTRTLRISIRERDGYICQICGEQQGDVAHCVHHIDYDKKNCNPNNLITLCLKCHLKTNKNRDYWIKYFFNLSQITGYKYKKEAK